MMLANHTSIRFVFQKILNQYKKLINRGAFLDNYRKTKIFTDDLQEFYESAETIEKLVEEYASAENPGYIDFGMDDDDMDDN